MRDEVAKRRAIYGLGLRAIRYYVDTGLCVFCELEDGKHEEHCNVGDLADMADLDLAEEERAAERA